MKSPPSCRSSVTVRRNPHRKARPTPSSAVPLSIPPPSSTKTIPSFPIDEILSININHPQNPDQSIPPTPSSIPSLPDDSISENLKVFLRIRPLVVSQVSLKNTKKAAQSKNAWPQNPREKTAPKAKPSKKSEISLTVKDLHSVTLCPPQSLQDQRRVKTEIYEGFSHVFAADSSQDEVYGIMVNPLIEDFLKGKSGMLAALGPSGSGKTHTVFGSIRDPGMVPLALRKIFSQDASNGRKSARTFYLSMFEIHSERGKGEKVLDLSQDGGHVYLQQSTIKGLQEVAIFDAQQAESLIACGMSKRATAMTNSNSQSSRSQCIINIRSALNYNDVKCDTQSNDAMLTIVDLAGAEREKRTGNQGVRLLESNFINNTSMVFGLCLRSLLEHQKNPKKPLQKHFQNSLLTKYLRDYLEGKKRMTLILTVKPGGEDYSDASFLLRQASPFMNIKFDVVEELPANSFGNKRQFQTFPKAEPLKRMKITNGEASTGDKDKGGGTQFCREEASLELVKEHEPASTLVQSPSIISLEVNDNKSLDNKAVIKSAKRDREHQIMIKFGKALWNVLKEYKRKLEVAEDEIHGLKESLAVEKERRSQLEDELNEMKPLASCANEVSAEVSPEEVHELVNVAECQSTVIEEVGEHEVSLKERLTIEVERYSELEKELNDVKSSCSCGTEVSPEENPVKVDESIETELVEMEQCQSTSMDEVCVQVSSSNLKESHRTDDLKVSDSTAGDSVVISLSDVENSEAQTCQKIGNGNSCDEDFEDQKHEDGETASKVTGSMLQESVVISSQSQVLVGDDSSALMVGDKLQHDEEVNEKISSLNFKDSEDTHVEQISNFVAEHEVFLKERVAIEVERCCELEKELNGIKPCRREVSVEENRVKVDESISTEFGEIEQCHTTSMDEVSVQVPSSNLKESHHMDDTNISDSTKVGNRNVGCCEDFEDHKHKDREITSEVVGSMLQESIIRSSESQILVGDDSSSLMVGFKLQNVEQVNEQISSPNFKDSEDTNVEQISNCKHFDNPIILPEDTINFEKSSTSNVSEAEAKSKPSCEAKQLDNSMIQPKDMINSEKSSTSNVSETEAKSKPSCEAVKLVNNEVVTLPPSPNLVNSKTPKRGLQPASSILLKDKNALEFDDENEKQKKQLDNPTILSDDIIIFEKGCTSNVSEVTLLPSPNLLNPKKPKRRLQPASSTLLKNINALEFDDENEKPKGRRKEKKATIDVTKKTQGNIALLRLLKDNLHL